MSNTKRQTLAANCTLEKVDNVVILHLNGATVTRGSVAGTIPSGYRPNELVYNSAYIITETNVSCYGFFQVSADGIILTRGFYGGGTSAGNAFNGKVYGTICWCL